MEVTLVGSDGETLYVSDVLKINAEFFVEVNS